jgi:hypothetical protein
MQSTRSSKCDSIEEHLLRQLGGALRAELRDLLMRLRQFNSDASLKSFFACHELVAFAPELPVAASLADRVDGTIALLGDRWVADGVTVQGDSYVEQRSIEQVNTAILRQIITTHFSDSELRDLCFDLNIDYENLPGQGKGDRARELVEYVRRHKRIAELVKEVRRLRPTVDWPNVEQTIAPERLPDGEPAIVTMLYILREDYAGDPVRAEALSDMAARVQSAQLDMTALTNPSASDWKQQQEIFMDPLPPLDDDDLRKEVEKGSIPIYGAVSSTINSCASMSLC